MRIYDGAPRQNYAEVLRSVGAILDRRGVREISIAETDDGFFLQGLAVEANEGRRGELATREGIATGGSGETCAWDAAAMLRHPTGWSLWRVCAKLIVNT